MGGSTVIMAHVIVSCVPEKVVHASSIVLRSFILNHTTVNC